MAPTFKCCCPTDLPPVSSDYQGKGRFITLDGVKTYVVSNGTPSLEATENGLTVVAIYDIFGFHGNTRHFCDVLSTSLPGGCRVMMPDVLQGEVWSFEKYAPEFRTQLVEWCQKRGNDDISLRIMYKSLFALMKNEFTKEILDASSEEEVDKMVSTFDDSAEFLGTTEKADIEQKLIALTKSTNQQVMAAGFCFGAAKACRLAHCGELVKAVASFHPSFFHEELMEGIDCPSIVINAQEDPDNLHLRDILAKSKWGHFLIWDKWEDVHHGFCSARGNYDNPVIKKRAEEAIQLMANLFQNCLKPTEVSASASTVAQSTGPAHISEKINNTAMFSGVSTTIGDSH